MAPLARWTQMDSPVELANDEEVGRDGSHTTPPTQPLSPSGLTGGSMAPPARWTPMDSPVKPANDKTLRRGQTYGAGPPSIAHTNMRRS